MNAVPMMMKRKLIAVLCVIALSASGQQVNPVLHFRQKVPPATFGSCLDVESYAKGLLKEVQAAVYVMELFPPDQYSLFYPFPTEGGYLHLALTWLRSYQSQRLPPRAILYFVKGRYAFRCRDNHENFSVSNGPNGNPLQLQIGPGNTEIWHFSITENGLARVFVITDQTLELSSLIKR